MVNHIQSKLTFRIPKQENWPEGWLNQVHASDSLRLLQALPDECVALIVTSPPYWNMADYGSGGQIGHSDYERYLQDLLLVWRETCRVLIPNGKLAIVSPIMPIPKKTIPDQHTRHLKNISADIEHSILSEIPALKRFSLFVWQKQTSIKMFGSYPFPPNIYEDNTIEFINVFVKDGKPPSLSKAAKEASRMSQESWRNLSMQVWPMYPADVKRSGRHPCPFPVVLPMRLIQMYTFKRNPDADFAGDIILDPFNGTGATCLAARAAGRNYIDIDLNAEYCETARHRSEWDAADPSEIFLYPPRVRKAVSTPPSVSTGSGSKEKPSKSPLPENDN